MNEAYQVYGSPTSPFSMKVRSAFRAKQLPMVFRYMTPENQGEVFPNVRIPVIPIVKFPNGDWKNDSTPLLMDLEDEGRALLPDDPAARFACLLLEDMADEWFMKTCYYLTWGDAEGGRVMSRYLAFDSFPNGGEDTLSAGAEQLYAWQGSRNGTLGTTAENFPALFRSFQEMVDALEAMALGATQFLFGNRPSLADMAFYGPMAPLAWAPDGRNHLQTHAPTLLRWLSHAEDASGMDGDWSEGDLVGPVRQLLAIAGRDYLPFLLANAHAREAGEPMMSIELDGGVFTQKTVGYQAKCLARLRQAWADLDQDVQSRLRAIIGPNADHLNA